MFGAIAKRVFGSSNDRYVKSLDKIVKQIAGFEPALQALSDEDLAKLKADLPKVKISFTPMTPEYRTQWNGWAAKKK